MKRYEDMLAKAFAAVPREFHGDVELSFWVPQCGPHHNEGGFLVSHLALVMDALEAMKAGEFHPAVPEDLRVELSRVINAHPDVAVLYVLVHDVDKGNTMTLKFSDGREESVSWSQWEALVHAHPRAADIRQGNEDALDEMLASNGIVQISYYQKTGDTFRAHGKVAADRLRASGSVPEIVLKAVETHEIAFQFAAKGGTNIPLFRRVFGGMSDDEIMFALAVNLADQMGSWVAVNEPDITPFLLLAETAEAHRKLSYLEERFKGMEGLDAQKVEKVLSGLLKATDAFRNETVGAVCERIVRDCAIPKYSEPKLREMLQPLVNSGTIPADLLEPLVAGLVANGAVPADIGKQLGKANKPVRDAIAGAIVG